MLLVLMNGFFVAAEFAMVKARDSRIDTLIMEGNKRAKYAKEMIDHLDDYLSACQLGITLASLGLGWIGEPAVAKLIEGVKHDLEQLEPEDENYAEQEEELEDKLYGDDSLTQLDMNLLAADIYTVWDNALNDIWNRLKQTLSD